MIKLSRKSFLKTLGLGMSAILLEDFPVLSAFAANENTMIDPHDLVSELKRLVSHAKRTNDFG